MFASDYKKDKNISFIFSVTSFVWSIISSKSPLPPSRPLRNDGAEGEKAFQCEIHAAFKRHRGATPPTIVITHLGHNPVGTQYC